MTVELALFVISIGLSFLAAHLLDKENKALVQDDKPTTVATRGAFLPRLIGRRRIGFVFAAAGNRQTAKEPAPGGKGGVLGGPKVTVFREDAWHLLCVGPAFCLWRIEQNGDVLFDGPITIDSHPSGSTVDLGNEGAFRIFWGENGVAAGQPVNTSLNALIGLIAPSSWPQACYIQWIQKRMGPSPNWPVMTYVVETRLQSTILTNSIGFIPPTQVLDPVETHLVVFVTNGSSGTAFIRVPGTSSFRAKQQIQLAGNTGLGIDTDFTILRVVATPLVIGFATDLFTNETISGASDDGVVHPYDSLRDDGINPAHAIAELLFEPWPYGIDQPAGATSQIDIASLETLGTLMITEQIHGSWIAPDGQDLQGLLAGIHQDLGLFWPMNFRTGLLEYVPIRTPSGSLRTISADMQTVPPEIDVFHAEHPTSRVVFAFPDQDNQYRDMTITVDDDGQASFFQYFRQRQVQIISTHLLVVASRIANRRALEDLGSGFGDFTIHSNRGARVLLPGEAITAAGFTAVLRVTQVKTDPESGEVEVSVMPDFYGAALSDFQVSEGNTGSGGIPVESDVGFALIEVPEILTGPNGPQALIIPRIRNNTSALGADLHISSDDTTFVFKGNDGTIMSGGTIDAAFDADSEMEIDFGPLFTAEGPDIASVLDLSADVAAWRGGRQLVAAINAGGEQEIMFLQRIVNISGDTYQMRGLIRARFDTKMRTHSSSTRFFILEDTDGLLVQDSIILTPSVTVHGKSAPTGVGTIPLAAITSESLLLYGKGARPITPSSIRLDLDSGVVGSGRTRWTDFFYFLTAVPGEDDLIIRWAYSTPQLPGTGAGQQGAGTPVVDPLPEGNFVVEVLDGAMVVVRSTTVALPAFTYVEADRIADFTGEPASFTLRVTQLRGGFQSDAVTQLFTQDV